MPNLGFCLGIVVILIIAMIKRLATAMDMTLKIEFAPVDFSENSTG